MAKSTSITVAKRHGIHKARGFSKPEKAAIANDVRNAAAMIVEISELNVRRRSDRPDFVTVAQINVTTVMHTGIVIVSVPFNETHGVTRSDALIIMPGDVAT